MREAMPQRRRSENVRVKLDISEGQSIEIDLTTGYYDDGRIGEMFVSSIKSGVTADAMFRDAAIMISLALQHGASLDTIAHAVTRNVSGAPSSFAGALVDHLIADGKA